jgi:hypothetical protein
MAPSIKQQSAERNATSRLAMALHETVTGVVNPVSGKDTSKTAHNQILLDSYHARLDSLAGEHQHRVAGWTG